MKILNLNIDELHLLSEFTDYGFKFNLGKINNANHVNTFYVDGENLCDSNVFTKEFQLSQVGSSPRFELIDGNETLSRGYKSKETHNGILSSVLSIDGETLIDCVKIWGNDELISSTELLAIGIRPCENRSIYPFALLKINKGCDYEVANSFYSCDTDEQLRETKHEKCYNMEDIIMGCLAGKIGSK